MPVSPMIPPLIIRRRNDPRNDDRGDGRSRRERSPVRHATRKAGIVVVEFVTEAEGRRSKYPDIIPTEINTAKWFARRIRDLVTTEEP